MRVLSRNHPAVDEGWLCDRGRYATPDLTGDRPPDHRPLIRGGRGLERGPEPVLDHVADRLRATIDKFGAGSVAILASGEQTNEEAYVWSRHPARRRWAAARVVGPEGGAGWAALRPYAAAIADLDAADAIVVAGYTDLGPPRSRARAAHPPGGAPGARLVDGRGRRHPAGDADAAPAHSGRRPAPRTPSC